MCPQVLPVRDDPADLSSGSNSKPRLRPVGSGRPGFTLIELLVVMVIIAIVTTLVVPAVTSILRGSQLTQAKVLLENQLAAARQTALTKNRPVEVRFYQFASPDVPSESATNAASGRFRALQCFELPDTGAAVPSGKVIRLPPAVVIDSGAALSTLIGDATGATSLPSRATDTNNEVPGLPPATQYNTVAFRFQPDGSTNLPGTGVWFLTLYSLSDGDNRQLPPPNFFTLQIDPFNGHVQSYPP